MSRNAGLDAARTVAILLVVAAHTALPFMITPMGWAIQDRSRHIGFDLFVFSLHGFGMPLFFWLSGFASRAVLVRGGIGGFARNRLTRIALPLAVALVPCSYALDWLWELGREVGQRGVVASHVPSFTASEVPILLGHLWYLYYLLWMSLGAVGLVRLMRGVRVPTGYWLLAIPATIATAVLIYLGILQPDTPLGFVPELPVVIYMGAFFVWGWLVHARPDEITRYRTHAWRALLVALPLLALTVVAMDRGGPMPLYAIVASGIYSVVMIVGFLGVHVRYLGEPNPLVRRASDASYWTYIAHLPLVVLLQILLADVALPGVLKAIAILVVTTGVCFISYEVVVRRFLNQSRSSSRQR